MYGEIVRKIVYDPSVPVSYGEWVCPLCGNRFSGGGPALHQPGCSETGYEGCEYHFSEKMVAEVISVAKAHGEERAWWGISLRMLREQCPEVLPEGYR